jgi:5-methylcytosine-specific restriction endonuclease McrA
MTNPCPVPDPLCAPPLSAPPLDAARESSRRLAELLRHEQAGLAEFLVALAEFDRERLWLPLGHASLFSYLHHDLQLSNAAAHYRKVAAGLIQRFPEVVEPLRQGKLCLTSVADLARVMTPENRAEILPRFFYRSKREARELAVEIRPADVIPQRDVITTVPGSSAHGSSLFRPGETEMTHPPKEGEGTPAAAQQTLDASSPSAALPSFVTEPLTIELCRIHVTVKKRVVAKLDSARAGQSHMRPKATMGEIIEAALDLLLEKQARRRSEVVKPQANPRPSRRNHVPAAVRRAVWKRDEGRCIWPLDSGGICGSTRRVELDHIVPRALGGPSTADNCRLICRVHNDLAARLVFGNAQMDQYTSGPGARARF